MRLTPEAIRSLDLLVLRALVNSTNPAGAAWLELSYARDELARRRRQIARRRRRRNATRRNAVARGRR